MMDAATAAAMSDPESNRWFRRRRHKPLPPVQQLSPAAERDRDPVELTGRALLEEWRRERAHSGGPRQ